MIVPKNTLESGNSAVPFRLSVPPLAISASVESIFDYLSAVGCCRCSTLNSTISLLPDYIKCGSESRNGEQKKGRKRRGEGDKSTSLVNKTLTGANERERERERERESIVL